MICKNCCSAGDLITHLRAQSDSLVMDVMTLAIKRYFANCPGETWCDNQKRF